MSLGYCLYDTKAAEWMAVSWVSWFQKSPSLVFVLAIASAFIDNIPFTATMLPIIAFLNQTIPGAESGVLWWSLSLGACLGGNGTMLGASANVVTVGLAEKAGYHIFFPGIPEGLLVAHDDHGHHFHGLPLNRILMPGFCGFGPKNLIQ